MSAIDKVVEANQRYAEGFTQGGLPGRPPSMRLAVLTAWTVGSTCRSSWTWI